MLAGQDTDGASRVRNGLCSASRDRSSSYGLRGERMLPLEVRSHSFRWIRAGVLTAALAAAGLDVAAPAAWAQGPPAGLPGRGPIVLEGELDVLYEDGVDTGRLVHFLRANNRRFQLRFADGNAPISRPAARFGSLVIIPDGTITTTTTDVSVLAVSAYKRSGTRTCWSSFSISRTTPRNRFPRRPWRM